MNKIQKLVTLADLAQELGVNKSQLNYWSMEGLLKPQMTVAATWLYDRKEVLKKITKIKKLQEQGLKIKEIKRII